MAEGIRVLCVDDELALLEIEKIFLEQSGELSVDVVLSAPEALNNLNKKSYDVIVSDYLMPEIDGIALLKGVRAVDKTIPFIFFTGRSREEVVIEALNNGANFYLHKEGDAGILYKELISIIRQSVQMRRTLITLAEKEQRYHDLQNANDLIQSVGPDGHFFFVNKKWLDTLGYEEQDLPSLTIFDIIAEESLQHCMETFQRVMSGENVGIIDAVFRTRDGKKVYVDGIADCKMVDGQPQYTRGLFKDVTERKRAEHELLKKNEELQESEGNLRKIFLNSAVGMTLASPDLRFLLVNPAWVSMMGYTEEEFKKMSFKDITHPDDLLRDIEGIEALGSGSIPVYSTEKRYVKKDGSTLWASLNVTTIRNPDGSLRHYLAQIDDITQRKQAEELVRESENKFATVFASSPVALTLVSATDGTFVDVNDAFLKNTGHSRDEVIGKTSEALGIFADNDEYKRLVNTIRTQRIVHDIEISCRIKTGVIRTCLFSSSLILIRGKSHIYSTVQDITERKVTESAFQTMVRSMVGTTGLNSLQKISENVSSWLGAECVMVGEIQADRQTVKVLSMLLDGKEVTDFSYTLKGTPCENVAEKGFCQYPDNAIQLFPESKDLVLLNIRGYIGTPLRNSAGEVIGILCALFRSPIKPSPAVQEIMDIIAVKAAAEIERRRAEEVLRESEEKFRAIFDNANDAITILGFTHDDLPSQFTDVNENACRMSGYTREELLSMSPKDLDDPEKWTEARGFAQKIMEHGSLVFERTLVRKDGKKISIEISAHVFIHNHQNMQISILRDITERKRAEEVLRESEERFRVILHSVQIGIVIIDAQTHTILDANKKALEIIGGTSDRVTGSVCHRFICPAESGKCPVTDLKQTVDASERVLLSLQGKKIPIIKSVIPSILGGKEVLIESFIDITDRKQAEEALKKSEEKFRNVFDWANDAILLHTLTTDGAPGIFTDVNHVASSMLGYSRGELLTMGPPDIVPRELHSQLGDIIRQAKTTEAILFETRLCRKDGSTFPVESSGHLVNFEGKRIWISHIRDISERKRAEEAFRESQQNLSEAMDLAHLVNWEFDVASGIFTFDDRFYAMYGTTAEREGGYQMPAEVYAREFVHPDEVGVVAAEVQKAITATDPNYTTQIEHRIIRRDGEIRHIIVRYAITKDAHGKTVKTHGANQDITERKRSEEALRESEKRYRSLLEHVPDPILVHQNGIIRYMNPVSLNTLGYTSNEALNRNIIDFIAPEYHERVADAVSRRINGEPVEPYEIEIFNRAGKRLTVIVNGSPIEFEGAPSSLNVLVDITERKALHDAVTLANKKLNLLSSITRHDIINQLLALNGYLELSRDILHDPAKIEDYITKLQNIAHTIETQIRFTKDYQDLGVKMPVWQNVNTCIRNAMGFLHLRGVRIEIHPADLETYADPLFEKVFYNLIDNALQYGGNQMKTIRVSSQESDTSLTIIVEDDGVGITDEDKKKLFRKGFGKHTGLGLFLSREILEITEITITENGTPGKGARFEIVVPKGMWRMKGANE